MDFTYKGYRQMLANLHNSKYEIATYFDWKEKQQCAILRHDIDYDISKAVDFAAFEHLGGVISTYFVLLTSEFYNVFSKEVYDALKRIRSYGHIIGLHFDETRYPELRGNMAGIRQKICDEAEILSVAMNVDVKVVSMHRPSKEILDADLKFSDMVNSYGQEYFSDFKYISDSRHRWREPVDEIIESQRYKRLHVLTHSFWYNESEEDIHKSLSKFINRGNHDRYRIMESNITDLASIMPQEEVK